MAYVIKTIDDISKVSEGNVAEINVYNWGCEYRPYAQGKLCFIKDQGFVVELLCKESNPRAVYVEQNTSVCKDSCLEFFANFKPLKEGTGYINFECNANGSLLCCYGSCVEIRNTVIELGAEHPKAEVFQTESEWGYRVFIPLSLIETIYGEANFKVGDHIKGNFFKCGDDTEHPHYGSYTKIEFSYPSFHRPEFFADMIIK
ncbi:carbohydrate-binding family 9-like protein [Paludicola sp. MB14-C6]|uniref:carbohydrate-binding family 9-like protein n=1 Tax=Paludihabitans sp. MB14-C6 TaxID=3070656 RepID=UPI0027DDC9FD|nr:carbohydrate-binding family 9-like protein [Paludicola sp. MB14-C6]WMJ21795.1 carbohydrate-binding family 9-like protein [Paludicola sp. MB14-C6]